MKTSKTSVRPRVSTPLSHLKNENGSSKLFFSIALLIGFSSSLFGQYSETFGTANKGILVGPCSSNTGTTCASNDFSGVNWTVSGNLSGMDSDDYFKTLGGVLTGSDLDEEVCWYSPLLDISSAGNDVDFTVDVFYEGLEASNPDYARVDYSLNGGAYSTVNTFSGAGPATVNDVGVSGLSGNTLQIRLCADINSGTSDFFNFDNVEVLDAGVSIYTPSPELDVKNGGGSFDIADGSNTISTTLGTDFGSRCVNGGTRRITFRAVNTGTSTLSFGADALAISNTTDFTIVNDIVNNGTLASNVLDSFAIVFDPVSAGTKDCTVTIRSDDTDEDPYTFLIRGVGIAEPTTAAAGPDQSECVASSFTMAANTPIVGTGSWSEVTATGVTITTPNSPTTTVTGLGAGQAATLRWTISNDPCTPSFDDVVISTEGIFLQPGGSSQATVNTCCGTFKDHNGDPNYSNNQRSKYVVCPDVPGNKVQANFTSFNTESFFDSLAIWDGVKSGTGSPGFTQTNLKGVFWGTNSPGIQISNDPSGCLTFYFRSDGSITNPGWEAELSCVSCTNPEVPTLSFTQNPVCPGATTTLNISGNLNDATEWRIYSGSCGGTLVGSTTNSTFNVSPTSTTTYYVRGEGGCVTPGTCASITANTMAAEVSVSVSPAAVTEDGAANLVYTFTRSCTGNAVTVNFDVDGSLNFFNDYSASGPGTFTFASGTVTMAIGVASASFTIDPTVDNKPEQDEDLTLTVLPGTGYSVGSPSSATGTVEDDDAATISITDVTMSEGDAGTKSFCFTISSSVLPEEEVLMTAMTANGTATNGAGTIGQDDYIPKTDIISINSDFQNPQFCVTVKSDDVVELNENFFVNLSALNANGQNVTFADTQGEGTILNDDQCVISFINQPFQGTEGNSGPGVYQFHYNSSNPIDVLARIAITHSSGTATLADNDYATTFFTTGMPQAGGNATAGVPVFIGDTKVEPDETFQVTLSQNDFFGRNIVFAGGGPSISAPVTILNDDIDWGDAPDTYQTLSASGGPSHGGSNLKLGTTNDGEANGQPSANADGDGAEDDGVSFTSTLLAGTNATVSATSSGVGFLDAWVDFNGNGNFADIGERIFSSQAVVAGANNLSFAVPGTAVQGTSFARFRLSSAGGLGIGGASTDGEVEDYQVAITATLFSIDDPMVLEGDAGTTDLGFTVSRSTNASDCSVNYAITGGTAVSGDDYQPLAAGTVNFTAGGALTQTVNVVVNGDMVVELDETVEMTLSAPVNGNISDGDGTGTIKNDDSAIVTMSNPFITEGDAGSLILTFNVNTDKPVDVPINFDFVTSDGTATLADNDYQANSGNTSIPAGNLVQYIQVLENGDCQIEPDEFFNMTLSNLMASGRAVSFYGGGGTLGSTGTINNDDALPEIYVPASFSQPTDPDQCSATVTVPLASTASICGTGVLEFRYRPVDASNNPIGPWSAWIPSANNTLVFQVGRYQVEWRITDGSGSNVGNFYFNVFDGEGPKINCMPQTVQLDANGNGSIDPSDVYAGGSDNCGPVTLVFVSPNAFDCSNLGDVTVTLTAVDGSGNPGTCTATVAVVDNIAPVAACQDISIDLDENGMASIVPSDVDGGTSDNCGFTLSLDDMDFDCGDIPSATVTLTATDGSNNGHSCTATVTVNDVTPPTVLCMDATVQLDASGNVGITPATIFAGSSDNCGFIGLYPLAQTEFDCDDIGPNTVTLNVFDGNGNDGSCSSTVTVEDNQPAIVACNDLSLELDNMGQASITPSDLFDAANSTDNCGTFNLTGLSQGDFTCVDEGTNTVTLFVEDAGGNVSTCTGTVTIAEFLQILSVTHTDASCQYTGDGTISIVATAPYGQLFYSVDGGATWQTSGEFGFLSPGTYDIIVEVHGIPSMCVKTATETVGIDPNGIGMTWYQDQDQDGYSNGNTLTQCERPDGFFLPGELIATSGDCDDHDPNEFPGQTWMKDSDGDGYSDGTIVTSCSQPMGYGLNLPSGDCNDDDAAVNPGAVEICNGIDDDCDGEVDEGTSGGLTFVGNVLFTSQAQVDAFSQCYSVIDGNLTVQNSGVNDLSNLINLTAVTGNVHIKSTGLAGMGGLDNLAEIGGYLKIQFNHSLTTLDGLGAVASVGGQLNVYRNTSLTDCCAIHALLDTPGAIGGSVIIALNDTGCDSVAEVETACAGSSPLVAPPNCVDCGISVSSVLGPDLTFEVYPNPASTELNIKLNEAPHADGRVSLHNSLGQVVDVYELVAGNDLLLLDIADMIRGEYFIRVSTEKGTLVKKVWVMK